MGERGRRGRGIVSPINIAGGHGTRPWVRDGGVSQETERIGVGAGGGGGQEASRVHPLPKPTGKQLLPCSDTSLPPATPHPPHPPIHLPPRTPSPTPHLSARVYCLRHQGALAGLTPPHSLPFSSRRRSAPRGPRRSSSSPEQPSRSSTANTSSLSSGSFGFLIQSHLAP